MSSLDFEEEEKLESDNKAMNKRKKRKIIDVTVMKEDGYLGKFLKIKIKPLIVSVKLYSFGTSALIHTSDNFVLLYS